MDFADTPEHARFRAEFRAWLADNHTGPTPDFRDSATEQAFRMTWHRTMYDGGWLGLSWPRAYGGRELSPLFEAIINEELGEAGVLNAVGPLNWLGRAILLFGTEEQRQRYLAPLLRGETQWCQGFSEPGAGSDLAGLSTYGELDGDTYLLTGQKWFCSAPMCDAFLVLAQTPGGLTCFLMPRVLPDGTLNRFHIQRLKDKLGNRSNASAEVELVDAWAEMVGEEGRGVRTIIEMVNHTRLDCVIGSASLMRQAVAQATHHTAHRSAFGKLLSEQPLMVNVLADIAVESEATTILMMRLAGAFDRASDTREAHFRRLALAV